jgi:hypothetical protein
MTAKNLYAYTLQPVTYEITEAEQRDAQLKIWRSTNKISMKAKKPPSVMSSSVLKGLCRFTSQPFLFFQNLCLL